MAVPVRNEVATQEDFQAFLKQMKIRDLETECKKLEQVECPVEHEFADGVYIRRTSMPAGTFAIGKRHRFRTFNVLIAGEITVYMGENEPVKRIKAPCTFVSDAGVKKIAFFHEDTIWLNVHPTEETDIDKIESHFIIPDSEFVIDVEDAKGEISWPG